MPTRRELANAIRAVAMDAVRKANAGHPGAPLGMTDIAALLWRDVLKFNAGNLIRIGSDRFVLSSGPACRLLYAVLHLTGCPLPIDEIKEFRQFGSKTPALPGVRSAPAHRNSPGLARWQSGRWRLPITRCLK